MHRVSHQLVVQDLFDMHVPAWLLRILISYLTGRSMTITYKGAHSTQRILPGSTPQGAFLGIFLFIIKYNGAALRPSVPRIMYCKSKLSKCRDEHCPKHPKETHVVYVDDLAEAEAIDLKLQLIPDPVQRPKRLTYHERTSHIFPVENSLLQRRLLEIERFSEVNLFKINESK